MSQRFGMTALLHLSCRDRNVIGLQSDLMGMAALGIRHVLALTGDPAKVGDHPGATSVYDVTSIELLKIIGQLNAGLNANGKSIKHGAQLVPGCTFNPSARNLDAQIQRLQRKLAAGAQYVMTQPLFDARLVAERRGGPGSGVPMFIGIWPCFNGRQAEFLHTEVPAFPFQTRCVGDEWPRGGGGARGMEIAKVCGAVLEPSPGFI
jgi:homocysteine S-methyltransferase